MLSLRPSLFRLAVPFTFLALPACGDGTSTGSAGAAGSSSTSSGTTVTPHEPAVHRAVAAECTATRPAGTVGDPSAIGDCMTDSDCTAGENGRCVQDLGKPTTCSYDACANDADCGAASVCECRNPSAHDADVCVHGNCTVDADCGQDGYCSPSAVTLDPFCTEGVPIGSVGYFCHSAADECTDDADCGAADMRCFFDVDKTHFACFQLMCVL